MHRQYLTISAAALLQVSHPAAAASADHVAEAPAGVSLAAANATTASLPAERDVRRIGDRFSVANPGSSRFDYAAFKAAKQRALKWEIGFLALSAIDTVQTASCLKRATCAEANPLLGKHPSTARLIVQKVGFGALHFALVNRLSARNPRAAIRAAQISAAVQGGVVLLNSRVTF